MKPKRKRKKCKICGKSFYPITSLQSVCGLKCAIKLNKKNKEKRHGRLTKHLETDKLRRKADRLYQIACKKLYPNSIIDGSPTEVIHHFIFKSHSNNLRYDIENGVPLTITQHDKIHNRKSGSELLLIITSKKGQAWQNKLLEKSKTKCVLNNEHLERTIRDLNRIMEN